MANPFGGGGTRSQLTSAEYQTETANKLDHELRQAGAMGAIPMEEIEEVRNGGSRANLMQKMQGFWGDDTRASGGVLETMGDMLSVALYPVNAATKASTDAKLYGYDPLGQEGGMARLVEDELLNRNQSMEQGGTLFDEYVQKNPIAQMYRFGRYMGAWYDAYTNRTDTIRINEDYDITGMAYSTGIYSPPQEMSGAVKKLLPDSMKSWGEGVTGGYFDWMMNTNPVTATLLASDPLPARAKRLASHAGSLAGLGARETLDRMADAEVAGINPFEMLDPGGRARARASSLAGALTESGHADSGLGFWGNYAGVMALDVGLDPLTYISLGSSAGMKVTARVTKEAAEIGGMKLPMMAAGAGQELTLTKHGHRVWKMAASEVAETYRDRMFRGTHLLDGNIDADVTTEITDYMVRNWDRLNTELARSEKSGFIRGNLTYNGFEGGMIPGAADVALDALHQSGRIGERTQAVLAQGQELFDKWAKVGAHDAFEETTSLWRRERGLKLDDPKQKVKRFLANSVKLGEAKRKPFKWLFDTFDRDWNVAPDVVERSNFHRRVVDLEYEHHSQRYLNTLGKLSDEDLTKVSHAIEARAPKNSGLPHAIGADSRYSDEIEEAIAFVEKEMDDIITQEQALKYSTRTVDGYIAHILNINPAARDQLKDIMKLNGEVMETSDNWFMQQRLISTIAMGEEILGKGAIDTDALRLVSVRKRASLEMIEYEKLWDHVAAKHGMPQAMVWAAEHGATSQIVRGMARRNAHGVDKIYDLRSMFERSDSTARKLGLRSGDVAHNARIIKYLQRAPTDEAGGRFSDEGIKIAEELGLTEFATMHLKESDIALRDIGGIGDRQATILGIHTEALPSKMKIKLKRKHLVGEGGTPKSHGERATSHDFDINTAFRMMQDPNHPRWAEIARPRGFDGSADNVDQFANQMNKWLDSNVEATLMGVVENPIDVLDEVKRIWFKTDPYENMNPDAIAKLKSQREAPWMTTTRKREFRDVLPKFLIEAAKNSRRAAGIISMDVPASKVQMGHLRATAIKFGFNEKLLGDYAQIVIGKRTIDSAEEADLILSGMDSFMRKMEIDKAALRTPTKAVWRGDAEPLVKVQIASPAKNEGNRLGELVDPIKGIMADDGGVSVLDDIAESTPDGVKVSKFDTLDTPTTRKKSKKTEQNRINKREAEDRVIELVDGASLNKNRFPRLKKIHEALSIPGITRKEAKALVGKGDDDTLAAFNRIKYVYDDQAKVIDGVVNSPEMKQAEYLLAQHSETARSHRIINKEYKEIKSGKKNMGSPEANKEALKSLKAQRLLLRKKKEALWRKLDVDVDSHGGAKGRAASVKQNIEAVEATLKKDMDERDLLLEKLGRQEINDQEMARYEELVESVQSQEKNLARYKIEHGFRSRTDLTGVKMHELARASQPMRKESKRLARTSDGLRAAMEKHAREAYNTRSIGVDKQGGLGTNAPPTKDMVYNQTHELKELRRRLKSKTITRAQREEVQSTIDDILAESTTPNFNEIDPVSGNVRPPVGAYQMDYYLPESIAGYMEDVFAPDVPAWAKGMMRESLIKYDRLSAIYKGNLLIPWGGYHGRNLMSNSLLTYVGIGARMLQPQRMERFFKTFFYTLAKYGDMEDILGTTIKKKGGMMKWGDEIIDGAYGRQMKLSEFVEECRVRGVFTGVTSAEVLSQSARDLPDNLRRGIGAVIGGAAGGTIGTAMGAAAGSLAEQSTETQGIGKIPLATMSIGMGIAGAFLGGRKLRTAGIPTSWGGDRVTGLLQSNWRPVMRATEHLTETPFRLAVMMSAFEETGSLHQAQKAMVNHQNDWLNYSRVERQYLRRVFPFYAWTKFAVSNTFRQSVENTGRFSSIHKAFENFNGVQDVDPEDVPDWFHNKLAVVSESTGRFGEKQQHVISGFGAPIEDTASLLENLFRGQPITDVTREIISRGPFVVSSFLEGIADKDSFTGRQISLTPGSDGYFARGEPWDDAPLVLQKLVGYRPATANSKSVVNPTIAWILGETPVTRFIGIAKDLAEMDEDGLMKLNYRTLSRAILGPSALKVDPKTQRYFANKARIDAMELLLKEYGMLRTSTVYSDINKNDTDYSRNRRARGVITTSGRHRRQRRRDR